MLIYFSELKALRVETKSGTYLGKICDLVLEASSSSILKYDVKGGRVRGGRYLISKDQVLEISKEKIIVSDEVITELAKSTPLRKLSTKNASPALTIKNL